MLALATVCMLPACDAPKSSSDTTASSLTLVEFEDATRAIETYIAANRTREAELIARKLLASAAGDASAASPDDPTLSSKTHSPYLRGANEYAARAYFARAELAKSELSPAARDALVREAATCAAAASIAPASVEAIRFAAMLADRIGNKRAAQDLYAQALAVAPQDLATLLPAAMSALACPDGTARAAEYAAQHAQLAPDAAWSEGLHAEIALERNEPADALVHAQAAIARARDALEFRIILAKALRANNRASDAARMLGALSEPERSHPALAQQFALALRETGDLPAAARAWAVAVAANPDDAFARAETALAFLRAGELARAAAERDALKLLFGGAAEQVRIESEWTAISDPRTRQ